MIEDCNSPSSILILGSYLLFNHLSYHLHKSRMIVGAAGTDEANVYILGEFSGFDVEIIKHFDVIADKADGRDDDFVESFAR